MPRPTAAAILLAAAALAGGCGGDGVTTPEDFENAVVSARDRADFALAAVTRARTRDAFLERMDGAADTIADSAGDLEDAGAPETLEREAAALVDALEQLAFDVQATADQIRQPGFEDAFEGARGLSFESWEQVNAAFAELDDRGIGVAPLERH